MRKQVFFIESFLLRQLVNLLDYIAMRMRTSVSVIIRKSFEARIIEFNFLNCQLLFGAKCNQGAVRILIYLLSCIEVRTQANTVQWPLSIELTKVRSLPASPIATRFTYYSVVSSIELTELSICDYPKCDFYEFVELAYDARVQRKMVNGKSAEWTQQFKYLIRSKACGRIADFGKLSVVRADSGQQIA